MESSPDSTRLKDRLDLRNFVDRVVLAISFNEGNLTAINPNDAGYGISIGIRQWNQKAGELPNLFQGWKSLHPEKFDAIFGPFAEKLTDDHFIRTYNMNDDADLMNRIKQALLDLDLQDDQIQLSRSFVNSATKFGITYGFTSELGLALIADIVNQKGRGGAEGVLRSCGYLPGGIITDERLAAEKVSENSCRPGAALRFRQLKQSFSAERKAPGSIV